MKQAFVRFKNEYGHSKEYGYLTTEENLEKGELVVVEARDWYQVAVFERYGESPQATKFIVSTVDIIKLAKDKEAAYKKQSLEEQIELRIKEIERMNRLEKYAEKDKDLAKLLEEFKNIK